MYLYTTNLMDHATPFLDLTRHVNVAWTQTAHPVQVGQGPHPHAPILDHSAELWLLGL